MSAERCPECGAVGADCACARGVGFNPLRIRPYMAAAEADGTVAATPPQPVLGAVAQPGTTTATPFPTFPPNPPQPAPGDPGAPTTAIPHLPPDPTAWPAGAAETAGAPTAVVPSVPGGSHPTAWSHGHADAPTAMIQPLAGSGNGGPGGVDAPTTVIPPVPPAPAPGAWQGPADEAPTAMIPPVLDGPTGPTAPPAAGTDAPTAAFPPVAAPPHTPGSAIPGPPASDRTMRLRAVPPQGPGPRGARAPGDLAGGRRG
ncbi:hypothetical protein WDV06_34395 [Streptomyces racemochromogenes]|uniref:Uncharacterized protein n=1 Tax=Streptomyces racemochromogenes TaxID=67353 RepID=A0ABW7PQ50_9ACTN